MEKYILVLFLIPVSTGLTVFPQNVAGVNTFIIDCGSDTTVLWKTSDGNEISNGAYVYPNYTDFFTIETSLSGDYDLKCKASNCSQFVESYQCSDTQNVAYSQVVVLSSTPTCDIVGGSVIYAPQETITINCHVGYTGSWAPIMSWGLPSGVTYTINNQTTADYVSSQLVMTASTLINSKPVSMKTHFDQPTPGSINQPNYATNVIAYSYTWISPTFYIASGGSSLSVGAIIGIAFGVVIILVIIILLIIFLICLPKYRAKQQAKTQADGPQPPQVSADMWDTIDRANQPHYEMPSSAPVNMDMSQTFAQANRGEAYMVFRKPEIGKLNRSGMNMSQEQFELPSPTSARSFQENNGFSSFSPNPEPLFPSDTSRSTTPGPLPTYPYIDDNAPEKSRRRGRSDGGGQQVVCPMDGGWNINGSVQNVGNVFSYPNIPNDAAGCNTLV